MPYTRWPGTKNRRITGKNENSTILCRGVSNGLCKNPYQNNSQLDKKPENASCLPADFASYYMAVMDENTFTKQLENALYEKIQHLDGDGLKSLRDDFKLFQSAFQGMYNVLLRKGIIQEDPYKYELKISEVTTPSESPFAESEKVDQMSIRLSQFESYLDFLNNYYQFSVEFLNMGRIKRLASLTKYFNFTSFSENSPHSNTRFLAEMASMIRKGSDPLSAGIINEGLQQLDKTSRKIFQTLKDLTLVHKEQYKMNIRLSILPAVNFERDWVVTHREEAIRKIRQHFGESSAEHPFYPELVEEILMEEYSAEAQSLQDELLKKLAIGQTAANKKTAERNYKGMLLDGLRNMVGVAFQLEDALRKLSDNQAVLETLDKSFIKKLKRALREMMHKDPEPVIHEVEYLDPVSSERKTDAINFFEFIDLATKRNQALMALTNRNGGAFKRMEAASEDQIYKYLEKALEDLQSFFRKMTALDEFFLDAMADPEIRGKYRNIKIELVSLKNAAVKANQKRHEYIAQKEEEEQMKRLGIKDM